MHEKNSFVYREKNDGIVMGDEMKKFFQDIKKYFRYMIYSTKSNLKTEVANSYLNWLWWILDPLCFMLVYTFIVEIVFKTKEENLPVFVLIGLTAWNFFNITVNSSVKLIANNKSIVTKVYIPKYILLLIKMFTNLFKMFISWGLILIMMLIFKVPYTVYMLQFLPVLIVLFILSFGIACILMHFGVFVEDLSNVMTILLKLTFYLSGIFYAISTRVPSPYNRILLNLNPVAFIIDSFRKTFLNAHLVNYRMLGLWLIVGIILSIIGIKTIQKYENSYAKVTK